MSGRYLLLLFVLVWSACSPTPGTVKQWAGNEVTISGLEPNLVAVQSSEGSIPFPAGKLQVLLSLLDGHGAVKRVFHIIGGGGLDLSGVPDGTYTLVAETTVSGFRPPAPQSIIVKNGRFTSLELKFERIETDSFYYYWESDHEGREFEYSANEDIVQKVEFLDELLETYQTTSARILQTDYNIILGNTDEIQWNYDLASKLLKTVDVLPHDKLGKMAKFTLTKRELLNDIEFHQEGEHYKVKINLEAFAYASERLVKLNGKRGKFFSRRLFNALVHFFTNNGKDSDAIAKILQDKFGVVTTTSDYEGLTGESANHFQDFKPNELIKLISAFAEMPVGMHKIPGLRYLLRRLDGHPHPQYPEAAAVAWPRGSSSDSYIEFMDKAFISQSESDAHRLILHEKAHFLWSNLFSQELKESWIEVGNWFETTEAGSGWATNDTTAFVSAYAHGKNPNEDMAESIATYVLNPNRLISRAKKKFDFIEKRIMNGYRYISVFRDDLTFEVLNLFPDYDYPGKIRRVEVQAEGDGTQDKTVTITIELMDKEGIKDGAEYAFTRITSPNDTFKDLYLNPVDGNGHLLRGTLTIPNIAKSGYWTVQNISITDDVGNERHEGVIDFGFKLYINNVVEDITPPQYVANSLSIQFSEQEQDEKQVFEVDVYWNIDENTAMRSRSPTYVNMISLDYPHLYRITQYGHFNRDDHQAHVRLTLTEHHPPGRYGISYISMQDRALNYGNQYFSDDPEHEAISYITIDSKDPDTEKPVLDPDRISVVSAPVNPDAPDGSTNVQITFYAKDNKSGLGLVYYRLVDPLGGVHFNYFYHSNTYTLFYQGDPTIYQKYDIRMTLPKGSPPGEWGVSEVVLHDKAGNINTYNFLETIHFSLDE